jgi:phenylalanyl-tRNA synthetase beta chain
MPELALFESGTVYRRGAQLPDETHALGVLVTADVFAAKALLEAVLDTLRVPWTLEPEQRPFLHPGRSATVLAAGERVGFIGEVHPLVTRAWGLERTTATFGIDMGRVAAAAPEVTTHVDLTSFPSLRQDLAVVVAADVPAARVLETVRRAGGDLLGDVGVFDVYSGDQIGEGRVSLALHLEFRAPDRTLTDEDVAPVRGRIVAALQEELGGELRG